MRRLRVVTIAALAATSVAAATAPSAGARPADASALRAAGWDVTWPYKAARANVPAGAEVRLLVAPRTTRPPEQRRLWVSLVRLDAAGRPLRTVATRRLRRGTFLARLAQGGTRYLIAVKAGRRVFRAWVTTDAVARDRAVPSQPAPATPAPTPPPAPAPTPTPVPVPPDDVVPPCSGLPTTGGSATLSLSRSLMGSAGHVGYAALNTGPTCLYGSTRYVWERLVDGAWEPVTPAVPPIFTDQAFVVPPGRALSLWARGWGGTAMPTGRYRLVVEVALGEPSSKTVLYAELDIDAEIPEAPFLP